MEESIKQKNQTVIHDLSKDDIIKSLKLTVKEDTLQKFKLVGIILTMGLFIVAMVSVSIAANSFWIRATNTRLDATNTRLDKIEDKVLVIEDKLDRILVIEDKLDKVLVIKSQTTKQGHGSQKGD